MPIELAVEVAGVDSDGDDSLVAVLALELRGNQDVALKEKSGVCIVVLSVEQVREQRTSLLWKYRVCVHLRRRRGPSRRVPKSRRPGQCPTDEVVMTRAGSVDLGSVPSGGSSAGRRSLVK